MRSWSYLFCVVVCVSCSPKALSEDELMKYVLEPEHGLYKRVEQRNSVIELYYRPSSIVAKQEMQEAAGEAQRGEISKRYDSLDYFVLRLARAGREIETSYASRPEKFREVVSYLSYYIGEDLELIAGLDTLQAEGVLYTPAFGASESTSLIAVFKSDLKRRKGGCKIVLDDSKLGTGYNEFQFDTNDIRSIPNLKAN